MTPNVCDQPTSERGSRRLAALNGRTSSRWRLQVLADVIAEIIWHLVLGQELRESMFMQNTPKRMPRCPPLIHEETEHVAFLLATRLAHHKLQVEGGTTQALSRKAQCTYTEQRYRDRRQRC